MKNAFLLFATILLVCCQVLIFAQRNDPPVRRNKPPVHDKFRNQLKGTNQKYSNPNGLLKSFNSNHPTSISDLTEFQELPYQDPNISYYEVTPVALSNGNIMMIWASYDTFNFNDDTLYCATSSDGGLTWDNKKIITHLPFDAEYYLTGLQTISGRVIIFWTDNFSTVVTKMIFSDNNGDSWSSVFSIGSSYPSWYPSVSQSINGAIYLSYSRDISGDFSYSDIVFRTSTNDGLTWSAEKIIDDDQSNYYACNVIPVSEEELLAIYNKETNDNLQIIKRISTNGGNSWSTETTILDNSEDYEYLPRVIRLNNDSLCIVFVNTADYDLNYSFSADNGNNWSTPVQFTRYVGWDVYVPNFTFYNNKPFIAFASARWQQVYDVPHVWYGIAGITEDDNPPPAILYSGALYKSYFAPDKVETILGNIADESGLQNAEVNISLNGGTAYSYQLFDDGHHNDWGIGDGIFGVPAGPYSLGDHLDYNFSVTDIDNNIINVHGFAIDVVQHGNPINPNKGFEESPVGVTGGDITGWGLYQSSPASALFEIVDDTVKEGNRALKINVTALGVNPWDVQAVNYPFPVDVVPDVPYRYFIWAKADKDNVIANFLIDDPSFNVYGGLSDVNLTTEWQEYSFDFFNTTGVSTGRGPNHFGGNGNSTSLPIKFYIDDLRIVKLDLTVGVENDPTKTPTEFSLRQNYPNPFNPSTKIKYSIPQSSQVIIKVFDVLGNEIETLVNEEKLAGTYELTWNAANLPSGVYFYQLRAGEFTSVKKMLLLR